MKDQVNEAVAWVVPSARVTPDGSYEDGPDSLVFESEATDYVRRIGSPLYAHPSRGVVDDAGHVGTLQAMFAVCANERRMMEADALDAAIQSLQAAAPPAGLATEARTLEAVRAKLSPSEWAILCAAFQEHHVGARPALPAVPDDWVLVPREPTREMVAAGAAEISRPATATNRAHWAYAAMLATTPAHDQPEGEG